MRGCAPRENAPQQPALGSAGASPYARTLPQALCAGRTPRPQKRGNKTVNQTNTSGYRPLGLYLHIPFCARKCPYCDFYSVEQSALIDDYLCALLNQMRDYAPSCRAYRLDTLFVGGGTPSLLSPRQWDRLLRGVEQNFRLSRDMEVTVEVNPDSASQKQLSHLHRLGVNRLSIGAQSFDDTLLKAIDRLHSAQRIRETVREARRAGFDNVSLDLMYGLPGQTPRQFYDSLQEAFALDVEHLSAYGLKVEPSTPFGRMGDALPLPDDDTWADEYLALCSMARQAGYYQYEISNFAKPGRASRHNLKYWTLQEYLGLGPAAHSYFGNRRFGFVRDLKAYCAFYGVPPKHRDPELSLLSEYREIAPQDAPADYVMLSLRLTRGLDTQEFSKIYGRDFEVLTRGHLSRYLEAGLMKKEGTRYCLTPRGFLVSNAILADLIDWD